MTLGLLVVGSVLAVGTVHVPVLLAVGALATLVTALALHLGRARDGEAPAMAPAGVALALSAYTLLQALPMPLRTLEALAPANADVWSRALLPLGEGAPAWASLSLDPGASLVEVLKGLVYAGSFASAAVLGSRRGAEWGVGLVFGSAVVAALATLGHGLAGATRVFGLYQATFATVPWHVGPLLNPNNLAGYLNLGAMCGVGLLLVRRPLLPRWVVALGLATVVGVSVTAASRGGVLALITGFALLAVVVRLRAPSGGAAERSPWLSRPGASWIAVPAAGAGCLLAFLGASHDTWGELYDRNVDKLRMTAWIRPLVREHPLFGVGRGAFESVFPGYRTDPGNLVYTHIESFPAQWAAEWGLPVAAAALLALAWVLRPGRFGVRRSAVAAAAWVGLAILLLQNLVDLALEVPAVCIAAAVATGSVFGDRARLGRSPAGGAGGPGGPGVLARLWSRVVAAPAPAAGGRLRPAARAALVVVVGVAALGAVARWGLHDLAADRAAVLARYRDTDLADPASRARLREGLRAAMRRHPAEPYFPLLGAMVAWQGRDESPMPWLQRSLERSQVNGKAHLLLAEVLASRGAKRQALFELRLAAAADPGLELAAVLAAEQLTRVYDELRVAVPEGPSGAAMLDRLASQLGSPQDHALRARLDREAVELDGERVGPRARLAGDLIQALASLPSGGARRGAAGADAAAEREPPPCVQRAVCEARIEAHAQAIEARDPGSSVAVQLRARALLAVGRASEAERLLADACARVSDRAECLRARARAASQAEEPDRLAATVKELLTVTCTDPAQCAEVASWVADLYAGRREWSTALGYYVKAAHEEPTEARSFKAADVASNAGLHAQAAELLERVAKKQGEPDRALRERIERERDLAIGALDKLR